MRLLSLLSVLGATTGFAAAVDNSKPTTFDGLAVPPLINLTPKNFDDYMQQNTLVLVKHFNPSCSHCIKFAPTYQTVYEWYYTEQEPTRVVSFTEHYNFTFAILNCGAYFDICSSHGIDLYPTCILYRNGEPVKKIAGGENETVLIRSIEEVLRETYPNDLRPAQLLVPKTSASVRPAAEKDAADTLDLLPGTVANADRAEKGQPTVPSVVVAVAEKPAVDGRKAEAVAADTGAIGKPAKDDTSKNTDAISSVPKDDQEKVLAKDATQPLNKKTPAKPIYRGPPVSTATPNVKGASVRLTAESFQTLVTMTQEPWFVKFYMPWCHHCKAMAATWNQLAKEMQGKLNIGEVNCEKEARLCRDVRLKGYPTLLFFRGGERIEYDGLRGLGDFVKFSNDALALAGGVPYVDAAAFEALEKTQEVIFVYFYDFASTTEDMMALERLPLSLIGHASLVKTNDTALFERFKITTWPRLMVSREGQPTYYTPLTPHEMRNTRGVLGWMKSVWLPILPEMTASNAREIMDHKLVVLGILKRSDTEAFAGAIREMKSAATEWMDKQEQLFQLERQELRDAKQLRIEEAQDRADARALRAAKSIHVSVDRAGKKEVTFAWVDGVFWQRWVRTTYGMDVKDGERVIINDEDNRRYWDMTITGNPILPSRTSILETLNKVTASPPKIKPKLTISWIEKIFFDIRMTFSEHPYLSTGCVLGLTLGVASFFRGRLFRTRYGSFRMDDGFGNAREFKLPLLGSNANGKKD